MLKKLGDRCAFVGKVGDDMFGRQLRDVVRSAGVDVSHLVMDAKAHTTLAFVHTYPGGDRDFSFYRNPGADMLLTEDELPVEMLSDCRIFHFGSLSLTHDGVRAATRSAVAAAKKGGALISFDPNLRPPLWADLEQAREQIAWGLAQCDILKIADNELEFMTGETDFVKGAAILREAYPNLRLCNVTAGPDGSYSFYKGLRAFEPAQKRGGVIETTGAGDTFCACVLHFVLTHELNGLTEEDLHAMLRFANTAAYIVTTRKGAIRSMPERDDIEALLHG